MPTVHHQPGYVLHARAYRETSLLLEVFSRDHGRLGLIARGVRGARRQSQRAVLQPLQPLLLSWYGKSDLKTMSTAESAGAAVSLQAEALLSAFYLNELLLRLLPRGEPQEALFWRYAGCLGQLAAADIPMGWTLRRFERDMLIALGYGLALDVDSADDQSIDPRARYFYQPEAGPSRIQVPLGRVQDAAVGGISGAALIALRDDVMPDAQGLRELRRWMREVLLHHLGGHELRSWQVLGAIHEGLRPGSHMPAPDPDGGTTPQSGS